MEIPLTFDLHVEDNIAPADRAEAAAHAADSEALGTDFDLPGGAEDAAFPDVLAHLLMFDPAWLFARPWVRGWVVSDADA